MSLENKFKTDLIKELKEMFPGCIITHLDPIDIQGIPDLCIFYKDKWAVLEAKRSEHSQHRPNQDYYVEIMDNMSFAAFIYPENKEDVLYDLQRSFKTRRVARVSGR